MTLDKTLLVILGAWVLLHLLMRGNSETDIVAHRGAAAVAPENTLPAVRAGMESGALYLEIDVQRSQDGVLVVIHDASVDRTTDGEGKVGLLTFKQLRILDAGSWFSPNFIDTRIPSLEEVFSELGSWPGVLVIEAKNPSSYPGIEEDIAEAIWRTGFPRITVVSFDHAWLAKFRNINPDIPVGELSVLPPFIGVEPRAERIGVHWTAPILDPTLISRAHRRNLEVWVWTVDQAWLQSLLRWVGVDAITTNDPAAATDHLKFEEQMR